MINLRKYRQFTGRLENVFSEINKVELESLVSVLKECVYAQTSPMYSLPLTGTFSRLAPCFTCHRLPLCYCSSLLDGPKVPPSDPHRIPKRQLLWMMRCLLTKTYPAAVFCYIAFSTPPNCVIHRYCPSLTTSHSSLSRGKR